jgi:hypothetical protein
MNHLLQYKQRQVTFEYIEGIGPLLEMGLTQDAAEELMNRPRGGVAPDFQKRYDEFKAQFKEGDELWYVATYEMLAGFGAYIIVRQGEVVASIRSWVS